MAAAPKTRTNGSVSFRHAGGTPRSWADEPRQPRNRAHTPAHFSMISWKAYLHCPVYLQLETFLSHQLYTTPLRGGCTTFG